MQNYSLYLYYQLIFMPFSNLFALFSKNSDRSENYFAPVSLPQRLVLGCNKFRNRAAHAPLCMAPFVSLRFERYGRVFVCCHNNSFVAGTYPAQNLMGIWNGKPLKDLRRVFGKQKLHTGCALCADAIVSEKYQSPGANMFDNYKPHASMPRMLDFKTDNTCNLSCIMCFSFSSCRKESPAFDSQSAFEPYNDSFIDELKSFLPHLTEIRFSGGEPFLSPFYLRIWELAIEVNPQCVITVQTNGHILNPRIKELMDKGRFAVNVSIDSLNPQVYSQIRKGGHLQTVLEHIDFFKNYCDSKGTAFKITICPMRMNVHELPDLLRFAGTLNARAWFSIVRYPLKYALWTLPPDEIHNLALTLATAHLPESTEVEKYNKTMLHSLVNELHVWEHDSRERFIQAPFNVDEASPKVFEAIESYVNKITHLTDAQKDVKSTLLKQKAEAIMEAVRHMDIPHDAFTLLLKANHPDMFVEILDTEPLDNIKDNLAVMDRGNV